MNRKSIPDYDLIDYAKIKPNSVVLYQKLESNYNILPPKNTHVEHLRNNHHNGFLSEKATSNIKKALKYCFWLSGSMRKSHKQIKARPYGKLSLLTLTLSSKQIHPDNFIKSKMLNQFLVELRQYNSKLFYVWRAEKQKNGNIHFHLVVNIFIPLHLVLRVWNRIQKKHGYLQDYQSKHQSLSFKQYLNLYPPKNLPDRIKKYHYYAEQKKKNWENPNSVDIHGIKKAKSIFAYISKYLAKEPDYIIKKEICPITFDEREIKVYDESQKISGRIWFASEVVASFREDDLFIEGSISSEIMDFMENFKDKVKYLNYATILLASPEFLFNNGYLKLFQAFFDFFRSQIPKQYKTELLCTMKF